MISLQEVLKIHEILIERFGGTKGVRDLELLKSSLNRPLQTFDKKDLYPSTTEKAAALLESIVKNHPFHDGNKRIGYTLCRLILLENGIEVKATENEKYDFIIQIAQNKIDYEQILSWIKNKIS